MSYEAFFRERQQARYGSGKGRCCCGPRPQMSSSSA